MTSLSLDRCVALAGGILIVLGSGVFAVADVPLARSLAALLLVVWVLLRSLAAGRSLALPGFILPSLALVALMVAGLVVTDAPLYGAWKCLLIAVHWVAVPIAFLSLARREKVLESFIAGLGVGGLLYGALLYVTEGSPIALLTDTSRFFRLAAESQNPIYLGRVLGVSLLALFWVAGARAFGRLRLVAVLCVPPLLGYLAATASKGPILGFLAGAAAYGAATRTAVGRFAAAALVGVLLFGLLLSYGALPPGSLGGLRVVSTAALSIEQRVEGWERAGEGFSSGGLAAMLLGHGTGDFAHYDRGRDVRHYPHNAFLEVLYENGVAGLMLLVWFLAWPLSRLARLSEVALSRPSVRRLVALGIGFYVFALANAQVTGDVSTNELVPLSCAFILAVTRLPLANAGTETLRGGIDLARAAG